MPTTVDFPTIVNQALELFGEVFANEPARRHFAQHLTGPDGSRAKKHKRHQSLICRHHRPVMPQSLKTWAGCGIMPRSATSSPMTT